MSMRNMLPRIAVLVDTSTSWGRSLVTGIHAFSRGRRPWKIFIEARGVQEHLRVPRGWSGEGVIARISTPAMAAELQAMGLPTVNVSSIDLPGCGFPRVRHDTVAGAEMAARYLRARGFRHFAYFSLTNLPHVEVQEEAFRVAVGAMGGSSCSVYVVRPRRLTKSEWNLDDGALIRWLKELPKPVGLLTLSASCGRQITYACQQGGLRIPEDVALISGTDDDLLCELSHIPISAVNVATRQIGWQAAAMLDQMLRGNRPPVPALIPPLGVISRRSTDIFPLSDPVVIAALRFIRSEAGRPIQVNDVARHAGVSRRVLERRFMELLAQTPATEIRRAHRERAVQLLRETSQPIGDVAREAGFGSADYMAQVFRADLGQTPSQYRRKCRGL